jgi:hypothetical protein
VASGAWTRERVGLAREVEKVEKEEAGEAGGEKRRM